MLDNIIAIFVYKCAQLIVITIKGLLDCSYCFEQTKRKQISRKTDQDSYKVNY